MLGRGGQSRLRSHRSRPRDEPNGGVRSPGQPYRAVPRRRRVKTRFAHVALVDGKGGPIAVSTPALESTAAAIVHWASKNKGRFPRSLVCRRPAGVRCPDRRIFFRGTPTLSGRGRRTARPSALAARGSSSSDPVVDGAVAASGSRPYEEKKYNCSRRGHRRRNAVAPGGSNSSSRRTALAQTAPRPR